MENIGLKSGLMEDFHRLYRQAAKDGRGETLFGKGTEERAAEALKRGVVKGAAGDGFYFEFPFTGAPRMDLLLQYKCSHLPDPLTFEEGDGYGFQPFFAACAADLTLKDCFCGFSFDLSDMAEKDEEKSYLPGIYMIPYLKDANVDYVPNMLQRLGGGDRIPRVMKGFAAAPSLWQPYYAGYMPGRRDAPVRIGFIVPRKVRRLYAENPARLKEDLSAYAPQTLSPAGCEVMELLVEGCGIIDLQFDIFPDGTLGDGLAMVLDFNFDAADPRKSDEFMESSVVGEKMKLLQSLGLADDRRRQMGSACGGFQRLLFDGEKYRSVADIVRLNAVKIRFKKGNPHLAKGYLYAKSFYDVL